MTEWLHRFNKIPFNSIEDFFYIYFDSKITFICFRFVNEMQEFLSSNNVISSSYGWKKQQLHGTNKMRVVRTNSIGNYFIVDIEKTNRSKNYTNMISIRGFGYKSDESLVKMGRKHYEKHGAKASRGDFFCVIPKFVEKLWV